MKDEKFLELPFIEARQYAHFQGEPEETRLKALYLEKMGLDLDAGRREDATPGDNVGVAPHAGGGLGGIGVALTLLGVFAGLGAFFFNVGVSSGSAGLYGLPSEVANIDKIAIRHMILGSGLASFVSGWILIGAAHVANAIRRA